MLAPRRPSHQRGPSDISRRSSSWIGRRFRITRNRGTCSAFFSVGTIPTSLPPYPRPASCPPDHGCQCLSFSIRDKPGLFDDTGIATRPTNPAQRDKDETVTRARGVTGDGDGRYERARPLTTPVGSSRDPTKTAKRNMLQDLTECEKLAESERDTLRQTLHATRAEKERVRAPDTAFPPRFPRPLLNTGLPTEASVDAERAQRCG